jgi:ATP-dependent protease ClpP protease subunit
MQTLELYNEVGSQITVDQVRSFLNANKGQPVTFDISTLGGDLATGITIHDLIKSHSGKTTANIVGLTASAGTVIAIACDEVVMSDNALFLIHNGWREMTGNVYDFQKAAADLMKTDAIMVKMYREKTGLADQKLKDLMKASDWLSPIEALDFGFIDRVSSSGIKIAASVLITEAQGKINTELLTKLQDKMKIFGKDKAKADVFNVLALKDGKGSLLINADVAATGVEVAPLGAMTLEDGEYQLADGRKIVVVGDFITEVQDVQAPAPDASADTDSIVAAVLAAVQPLQAEVAEIKTAMAAIKSTHIPAKGVGPANPGQAYIKTLDVASKIDEVTAKIREGIENSRKA